MSATLAMIADACARHADRIAIEAPDGTSVTYRDLWHRIDARAAAIADTIASAGIASAGIASAGIASAGIAKEGIAKEGSTTEGVATEGTAAVGVAALRVVEVSGTFVVEIAAARSVDFIVECLACWRAGAAWLPVAPDDPAPRRVAIRARLDAERGGASRGRGGGEDALAYVIATSGSSGVPKAVMVAHRGVPALLRAQIAAFELGPGARSLWLHAPVFDASISDWGTALASGATLVLPRAHAIAAIADELATRAITHVDLPPALLAHVPPEQPPRGLRVVVLGGEACPVEQVRALARRLRVVVVYGPTETTVCSSLVVVDAGRWQRPLVGAPIPGTRFHVVDRELWIGGAGVALGYAGDPDETARRFVDLDGERVYRTGDRVERLAAAAATGIDATTTAASIDRGELVFLGRTDRQRKVAGHRIELDDVEAALRRVAGVCDAAVVVRELGGRDRLVAFVATTAPDASPRDAWSRGGASTTATAVTASTVTAAPERTAAAMPGDAATSRDVRAALRAMLPAWMVPSRIVVGSDALPRTPTGKLDYRRLAEQPLPRAPDGGEVSDRADAFAQQLAALWCETLGADVVDDGDRFRDAGGDSLAAVSLAAAARAMGIVLDAAVLASDPTFAELVEQARRARSDAALSVATCEVRGLAALDVRCPVGCRNQTAVVDATRERAVLLTGATGQLGRHLLRHLHARRVIALARGDDGASRRDLEIVHGDLAAPRFGLSEPAWSALAARVDCVVHAGATVRISDDFAAHAPANVDGTAEAARLAIAAGAAFHHISTLAVFVATDRARGAHAPADVPDPAARVFGGYAQTKVAAEAIARALRGRAAPTVVYRLGLLVGDERRDGDQLQMTIRGLAHLGAAPAGLDALHFDTTPLATAAEQIAALVEGARADAVHHIASTRPASGAELVAAIRGAGIALDELPTSQWAERARARIADPDVAMAYLALGRARIAEPGVAMVALGRARASSTVCMTVASVPGDRSAPATSIAGGGAEGLDDRGCAFDLFLATGAELGGAIEPPADLLDRAVAAALDGGSR